MVVSIALLGTSTTAKLFVEGKDIAIFAPIETVICRTFQGSVLLLAFDLLLAFRAHIKK